MPLISISIEAADDFDEIAAYTTNTWGWRQADHYLDKLEAGIDLLAQNPSIGRSSDSIHAGLRRFEIGKHVVFYLPEPDGILVVRVLHQRMLPSNYV
ncbi:MAG: type II toxin-antitoxin system RelE/ParE family toxin [Terracidiphilus sp.]